MTYCKYPTCAMKRDPNHTHVTHATFQPPPALQAKVVEALAAIAAVAVVILGLLILVMANGGCGGVRAGCY